MPPKAGKKSNNNVKHEPVDLPQATSIKPVDTPDDTFPKPVDPPDDTFPKPVDPPHDTSPGPPSLFWNIVANRQQAGVIRHKPYPDII
ncbi:hypothetical protein C2E23DRAFT_494457 [Lenzites betulinus]|nr:hypothetical protein C2E23DRAFT_494457 [Lenzites betulinus]